MHKTIVCKVAVDCKDDRWKCILYVVMRRIAGHSVMFHLLYDLCTHDLYAHKIYTHVVGRACAPPGFNYILCFFGFISTFSPHFHIHCLVALKTKFLLSCSFQIRFCSLFVCLFITCYLYLQPPLLDIRLVSQTPIMSAPGNKLNVAGGDGEKKLKPCCACPETRQPRDQW